MFDVQRSRLKYKDCLMPPKGYELAFAVGTTYSLDLEALTTLCAIVGLDVEANTELTQSPIHMLQAIRKTNRRILLFCQGGQIKRPSNPSPLLSLLEDSVVEINLKEGKSFHPKVWFLKYESKERPAKYRLIVLSKNLTFDRSWDIAMLLESADDNDDVIESGPTTGQTMRSFLMWLSQRRSAYGNSELQNKKRYVRHLAEEIEDISWRKPAHPLGRAFERFDFNAYGIGMATHKILEDTFHKLFIVTPFLSKSIIHAFAQRRLSNPDCTLITRKSELSKLDSTLMEAFETYTMKDEVVDGEEGIIEEGYTKTQDIHAKIYLKTKGSRSMLALGSANATHSAFYGGNVECMVSFYGRQRYLNVEKLKEDFFGSDEKTNPFEKVIPGDYEVSDVEDLLGDLESAIRLLSSCRNEAIIEEESEGLYRIVMTSKALMTNVELTLSPLLCSQSKAFAPQIVFSDIPLRRLSEWYEVKASLGERTLRRVIKIPTKQMPEKRDEAIFGEIVNNREVFLKYIALILSDDPVTAFLENGRDSMVSTTYVNKLFDTPILYERMLNIAANEPERLKEIRDVMALASEGIVPSEFRALFHQFEKVLK